MNNTKENYLHRLHDRYFGKQLKRLKMIHTIKDWIAMICAIILFFTINVFIVMYLPIFEFWAILPSLIISGYLCMNLADKMNTDTVNKITKVQTGWSKKE